MSAGEGVGPEYQVEIQNPAGNPQRFNVASFSIEGESGDYFLLRFQESKNSQIDHLLKNYEMLFKNIGDALLTIDLQGRILSANPAFHKMLGYVEQERPDSITCLYVNKEELEDKLIRLLEKDTVYNLETHFYTKDRKIKRVLDCSWVIRNQRGVVNGYTVQFKDVSYLKNLESRLHISERSYSLLFDTLLSSIIIVDPFGKILNINFTAEKLFGYKWEEISGQDYDSVFRPKADDSTQRRPSLTSILEQADHNNGRYIESEVPRICKDGTVRFTYTSYGAVKSSSGDIIAYSIMEKDLTERVILEKKLKESFQQIKQTQSAATLGFARLTEYRDKNAGKHLHRIREYTRVLATTLKQIPKYSGYITDSYIEDLCLSSVLHDVGKVAIEDGILLKTGKLDQTEYERIKDHASMGGDALSEVDSELKHMSFLTIGKEVAYYHHEWWNGQGYPQGRKGDKIPLSARIVSIADVYDALTSERPYKEASSHEQAVDLIVKESGTHFDPEIVDAFIGNEQIFKRIKIFNEFEEHPETIDDLIGSREIKPGANAP